MLKYLKTHCITATLEAITGLRIGAGRETIEIGGIDNPVIRHPHSDEPYIPGSSLKGKLRSLLEFARQVDLENDGAPYGSKSRSKYPAGDPVLRIFGTLSETWDEGPSRLIVRDAMLQRNWLHRTVENGFSLTEEKTEVSIDRIRGKAKDGGLRTMERIPAGARFDVELLFKEFSVNGDGGASDRRCLDWVVSAMKMLEQDALGGCGSRGYGRVRFHDLTLDGASIQEQFDSIQSISPHAPPVRLLDR